MALFLLFVLILLGAGWLFLPLLDSLYIRMLAVGGEVYYSLEGKNLDFSVRGSEIFFQSRARPRFEANLSPEAIYSQHSHFDGAGLAYPRNALEEACSRSGSRARASLPFPRCVFLSQRWKLPWSRWITPLPGAAWLWKALDNAFEIVGKAFFPILIWMALTLPYMMGLVDPVPTTGKDRPTGRNDPCPCGSGKKFKYCCGS